MSIYIIGDGSREEVIAETLEKSKKVNNITISKYLPTSDLDIDMVVIGNEEHIANGYKDFTSYECFAPSKKAAKIEGCKIFSKQFMEENNIPTPKFYIFSNRYNAYSFLNQNFTEDSKYVLKLPELYKGKGVFVPETKEEAIKSLEDIFQGNFTRDIIIEERVYGTEVSVMGFCNGRDIELMPQVMDYKRIYDGDKGPNTGGMGSIAPVNILNKEELEQLKHHMLKVVEKLDFRGVLYAGVMKHTKGYSILEFNCRFGDPETQVVLNLLDSDLYDIMYDCIHGNIMEVEWKDLSCACVVMSHVDYPHSKLKEATKVEIQDLQTKIYSGSLFDSQTIGGRVASLVSTGNSISGCLETIYNEAQKVKYEGKYYRRDIGLNYITKNDKRRLKIGILGSTKGTSIEKLLQKRENMNISIDVIVSSRPSAILEKGKEYNIPSFYLPYSRKNEDYYDNLTNILMVYDLDLILTVGFMNIFPPEFCDKFKGKLYNIHPSLLPRHKGLCGLNVHQSVIESNDLFSGCTIHEITPEVDNGRIKLQKQCKIDHINNIHKLKDEIQKLERDALIEFIQIQQGKSITYKDSGVDIDIGNQFVKTIKDINIGDFCGFFEVGGKKIGLCCDGVGTKLDIANKYNKLDNIGIDLVAMCVNDLIVRGFRPKAFLDYIAQEKLDQTKLKTIVDSIKEGCRIAGCELLGGETAEMPGIYFNKGFDLAGFSVGVLDKQLYPKIEEIIHGCKIYGLKSNGIHSNGFSLVRKLLKSYDYDTDILLKPTKIYTECLDIMKEYKDELLGLAHITGGGLIDNILRIVPCGLNIKLDIEIKDEFKWIMDKGKLTLNDMLTTFNCGYGIALIFKPGFATTKYDFIGEILKSQDSEIQYTYTDYL